MKSVQKNTGKRNLSEAAILAKRVAADFQKLVEDIKGVELDAWTDNGPLDTMKIIDELNGIKWTLNSLTDGRPKTIDKTEGRILGDDTERMRFKRWAECYDPGKMHVCSLGFIDLDLKELEHLQDWVASVIEWHKGQHSQSQNSKLAKGPKK